MTMTSERELRRHPTPENGDRIIWNPVDWNGPSRVSRNGSVEGDDSDIDPLTVPPRPQSQRSEENGGTGRSTHSVSHPHVFRRFREALCSLAGSGSQRNGENDTTGRSAHSASHPRIFHRFRAALRRLVPWNRDRPREQTAHGITSSSAPNPGDGDDGAAPQEPQAAQRRGAISQGQQTMGGFCECWWKDF